MQRRVRGANHFLLMRSRGRLDVEEITCLNESVFSGALTRGRTYKVIEINEARGKVKVKNDIGRVRWYPYSFFTCNPDEVVTIERILPDSLNDDSAVEVTVLLSDGTKRGCFFVTPQMLESITQEIIGSVRIIMYGVPHMIVVSEINVEAIAVTLRAIERRNMLLESTLPVS